MEISLIPDSVEVNEIITNYKVKLMVDDSEIEIKVSDFVSMNSSENGYDCDIEIVEFPSEKFPTIDSLDNLYECIHNFITTNIELIRS